MKLGHDIPASLSPRWRFVLAFVLQLRSFMMQLDQLPNGEGGVVFAKGSILQTNFGGSNPL